MADKPAPLVPPEVRFKDDKFVPIAYDMLRFGSLAGEPNSRVARAALALALWSWHGKPAGSLHDYGDRFANLAAESKTWWRKNGAKVLSYFVLCSDGQYYHPELAAEAIRRWKKSSPRRELDVSVTEWLQLRKAVFKRDEYRCVYCGMGEVPLHADHVLALSRGGASTMDNLVSACEPCNTSKGAKDVVGWLG